MYYFQFKNTGVLLNAGENLETALVRAVKDLHVVKTIQQNVGEKYKHLELVLSDGRNKVTTFYFYQDSGKITFDHKLPEFEKTLNKLTPSQKLGCKNACLSVGLLEEAERFND